MHKKAIILDFDNTIYSAPSIGDQLFARLLEMIEHDRNHQEHMEQLKTDIMRRPFQVIAKEYNFSEELNQKCIAFLKELTYNGKIEPFDDYQFLRDLTVDKFLVTTGFYKLQQSKIEGMKITQDFKEIHIVDPLTSCRTKKDVFAEIMERHAYQPSDVLVIGDDLHSEIKAAQELGIEAILYDHSKLNTSVANITRIENFNALKQFI